MPIPTTLSPRQAAVCAAAIAGVTVALVPVAQAAPPAVDDRDLELVTADLESGIQGQAAYPVTRVDGDRLVLQIVQAQSDANAFRRATMRRATRSATGWVTTDATGRALAPSGSRVEIVRFVSSAADRLLLDSSVPQDPAQPSAVGAFRFDIDAGRPQWLADSGVVGASPSADTVYINSTENLADGAEALPESVAKIYRRDDDGTLHLASRLPPGVTLDPAFPGDVTSANIVSEAATTIDVDADITAGGDRTRAAVAGGRRHPVSDDGRRMFFTAGSDTVVGLGNLNLRPLYLRDADVRTVAVSASRRDEDRGTPQRAQFISASPDGDVVLFASAAALLPEFEGAAIYRYQLSTDELTRVAGVTTATSFEALGLSSAWASNDARTLMFTSSSVLADGATEGEENAYVWEGGAPRFVASLGTDGVVERVSPSGRFGLFRTSASLVGAQTGGAPQLYRYDRASGVISCASCRSDGAENEGPSYVDLRPDATVPTPINTARGMLDDGRVQFTSLDRLVPRDPSTAADVYEFDGLQLRLLSNGEGASYLIDSTEDGRSVFMTTSAALLPDEDTDGDDFDIYVRRDDGGFSRPTSPAPCSGDGCQGVAAAPAGQVGPGSDRTGPGNVVPRPRPVVLRRPTISSSARADLRKGRRAAVKVRVQGPGTLSLRLSSRWSGRARSVGAAKALVTQSTVRTLTLRVKLDREARRRFRKAGRLRLDVNASLGGDTKSTRLTLRRAGR